MPTAIDRNDPSYILRRLKAMGVEARLMKGGRCVLASLALQSRPLDGLDGERPTAKVIFSTMGFDRIKCLRPLRLFYLPPIRIADCRDARAIEARIRQEWSKHVERLREARGWLEDIGANPRACADGALLDFAVDGEGGGTRAYMADRRSVVLPSRGPLEGLALGSPDQRSMRVDPQMSSSVDLAIEISTRLEELVRNNEMEIEQRRNAAIFERPPIGPISSAGRRRHTVLLAGPRLSRERIGIESLRLRGYRVITAKNEVEALSAFDSASPELVLADMDLGRSEGLDLVLSLKQVCGIENVPVVLVDTTHRDVKRDAARSVGAAGYVLHPLDVPKMADRLNTMVGSANRRRFTRFPHRLSVRLPGSAETGLLTGLGRGGMFITTHTDVPNKSLLDLELLLPELGRSLRVQAETVYQQSGLGNALSGFGMRFHSFEESNEAILIEFLRTLERR